ncbi:uncharacterized protein LY79DRAFT_565566 [Colletotrichum navitas]|uniref:Uncharacterized protein n=1 Tax=Colletotrichum navitas TaxID=681940 RepID=A0AAD8V0R8_9PEZI|nr:uncharacterized protein LY79DRAFT_565566 [Colletotrichum navitas]KAK1574588.1 hypothetical protein LY79DRAFT_565566 [Colletotrichum navitas]
MRPGSGEEAIVVAVHERGGGGRLSEAFLTRQRLYHAHGTESPMFFLSRPKCHVLSTCAYTGLPWPRATVPSTKEVYAPPSPPTRVEVELRATGVCVSPTCSLVLLSSTAPGNEFVPKQKKVLAGWPASVKAAWIVDAKATSLPSRDVVLPQIRLTPAGRACRERITPSPFSPFESRSVPEGGGEIDASPSRDAGKKTYILGRPPCVSELSDPIAAVTGGGGLLSAVTPLALPPFRCCL